MATLDDINKLIWLMTTENNKVLLSYLWIHQKHEIWYQWGDYIRHLLVKCIYLHILSIHLSLTTILYHSLYHSFFQTSYQSNRPLLSLTHWINSQKIEFYTYMYIISACLNYLSVLREFIIFHNSSFGTRRTNML